MTIRTEADNGTVPRVLGVMPYIVVPVILALVLRFQPSLGFMAVGGLLLFAVMELVYPLGAAAVILLLACSIIPRGLVPTVPLGGGAELFVSDLLVIYLAGAYIIRASTKRLPTGPVTAPLFVLVAIAASSAAYAAFAMDVHLSRAGSEFRGYMYLLTGVALVSRIDSRDGYRKMETILRAVAVFTAFAVCVQWASGDRLTLLAGNIFPLQTSGFGDPALFRIKPPGLVLMFTVFIITLAKYLGDERGRTSNILVLLALSMGLTISFHRYLILIIGLSAAIFIFVMPAKGVSRPAIRAVFLAAIFASLFLFLLGRNEDFRKWSDGMRTRVMSLASPEEVRESGSIQGRIYEYQDAWESIKNNFLFGVGLGNTYRDRVLEAKENEDFDKNRFVHNAYVMVQLKTGIFGFAAFLWLCGGYVYWWLKKGMSPVDCADPLLHRALGVAFLMLLLVSFLSSYFITMSGAPVVGAVIALNTAICRPGGGNGGSQAE